MTVSGKRVVVTGAGRGIGAELTAELRSRGAEVIGVDLAGGDEGCDVSDADQVAALFDKVGRVDGLVNCAALLVNRRAYDEIPLDEWDRMLAVNVRARSCALVPRLRRWATRRQHRQRGLRDRVHGLARVRPLRRVEGRGHLADPRRSRTRWERGTSG